MSRKGIRTNYVGNPKLKGFPYVAIVSNVGVRVPLWIRDSRLAPEYSDIEELKAGKITKEEFKRRFKEKKLSRLDPKEIAEEYDGYYLVCCEKDATDCHRTIIADWLTENGFICYEGIF